MAGNPQLQLEVGDQQEVTSFPSEFTDPWLRVSTPQKLRARVGGERKSMGRWGGGGRAPLLLPPSPSQTLCVRRGSPSRPLSLPSPEVLKSTSFLGTSLKSVWVSQAGSHLSLCLPFFSPWTVWCLFQQQPREGWGVSNLS